MKILLIEDKIEDLKIYLRKTFNDIKDIKEGIANINYIDPTKFKNPNSILEDIKGAGSFDLILVDLKFDNVSFSGRDILRELKKILPYAPVFVISWSYSMREILTAVKNLGVDWYIHKGMVYRIDEEICNFYANPEHVGKVLMHFDDGLYRSILRPVVLTANRHPEVFWHGAKPVNLVDHFYTHSLNIWKIFDSLYEGNKDISIFNDKYKLLVLSASIWLHDIGLKGSHDFLWPYEIRKFHALLSGYLIYSYPEQYLLVNRNEEEKKEGEKQGNFDVNRYIEDTALVCAAHAFGFALTKEMYETNPKIRKWVDKFLKYPSRFTWINDIYKKRILNSQEQYTQDIVYKFPMILEDFNPDMVEPAALLRLLDVVDKNYARVGIREEEDVKLKVCFEDALSLISELRDEVKKLKRGLMGNQLLKPYGEILDEVEQFCQEVNYLLQSGGEYPLAYFDFLREIKERGFSPNTNGKAEKLYHKLYRMRNFLLRKKEAIAAQLEQNFSEVEKIIVLLDQIMFLVDTPLHFITHKMFEIPKIEVEEIKVEKNKKIKYLIISNKFNEDNFLIGSQLSLSTFNWLFQEAWKAFSDIHREYEPLADILKDYHFKRVKFNLEGQNLRKNSGYQSENNQLVSFSFPLSGHQSYIEMEIKLKFDNQKEMENFRKRLEKGLVKFDLKGNNEKIIIYDYFFRMKLNDDYLGHPKGWNFRIRFVKPSDNSEGNMKCESTVKIFPLFWREEYLHRVEISQTDCGKITKESLEKMEGDIGDEIKRIFMRTFAENEENILIKIGKQVWEKIEFEKEDISLHQERKKYEIKDKQREEIKLNLTCDVVSFNNDKKRKKFYIAEIEASKDLKPWKQKEVLIDFNKELERIFTPEYIRARRISKDKFSLASELGRDKEKQNSNGKYKRKTGKRKIKHKG